MEQSGSKQTPGVAADVTDLRAIEWELAEVIRRLESLRSQVHDLQFASQNTAEPDEPSGAL